MKNIQVGDIVYCPKNLHGCGKGLDLIVIEIIEDCLAKVRCFDGHAHALGGFKYWHISTKDLVFVGKVKAHPTIPNSVDFIKNCDSIWDKILKWIKKCLRIS